MGIGTQDQILHQTDTGVVVKVKPGQIIQTAGPAINHVTEGLKFDTGKVGVHLLPPEPLIEIAKVLDFGAKKYSAYNWTKGISYSRVYGAVLRHLWAWWRGQDVDSETSISHLAHAGCCILFLLQYEKTKRNFDDRPVEEYAAE